MAFLARALMDHLSSRGAAIEPNSSQVATLVPHWIKVRQHTIENAVFAVGAAFTASGSPVQPWIFGEYDSL